MAAKDVKSGLTPAPGAEPPVAMATAFVALAGAAAAEGCGDSSNPTWRTIGACSANDVFEFVKFVGPERFRSNCASSAFSESSPNELAIGDFLL
jgi:hypothetical protein